MECRSLSLARGCGNGRSASGTVHFDLPHRLAAVTIGPMQHPTKAPTALEIADSLRRSVFGQETAIRSLSVALAKKLAGVSPGNALMIGASGSGKTTLMRAVDAYLQGSRYEAVAVRLHANVLGRDAEMGRPGEGLIRALLLAARNQLGLEADHDQMMQAALQGVVFIDEVDKIRTRVGDRPNILWNPRPGVAASSDGERVVGFRASLVDGWRYRRDRYERSAVCGWGSLRGALRCRLRSSDCG